ncbi:unnamed protein product [[Candida] boidinii]|nr:unnamed protein product [[Candida] boidinii]GMF76655.1 unnamed protein product [[Candida] boidinii]GMG01721.1 unnamed protein product [[Candida] boidinii]
MSAPLRNIARASRSKNILNSVRSYSTKEPVCTIFHYPTLKERFAEILPAKQEEVKKLKAEHGKTVSISIIYY